MYKRILIATDGTDLSRKASDSGMALAEALGAQVVVLNVIPRYPLGYFEGGANVAVTDVARIERQWTDSAQKMVNAVRDRAEARGIKAKAVTSRSDLVAESIIAAAKKHKCDLIVMASHGRKGLKRLLLGSETTQVLTHSPIPVLVLR
jgi:nucleotide-binding universal stress UspA family protein